ncbi:unnamed protein product [Rotaria magnacalcarata]|uniref:Uncharacterized protein n=1 Tax=Rotaria magnacalcarata TaxID=392030 RepID=A0A815G5B1_9BILA|nr:unnamed protein product [Rotaria magnacalcarata]CAF1334584.1 unnamed protein product [Rotaria magnacalcarata]
MTLVLIISLITLIVQLCQLKPLEEYKKTPTINNSVYYVAISVLTTIIAVMLCLKPQLPGLIVELEGMMITGILTGLSVEYFYNGRKYGLDN